jgi:hypothetical protein
MDGHDPPGKSPSWTHSYLLVSPGRLLATFWKSEFPNDRVPQLPVSSLEWFLGVPRARMTAYTVQRRQAWGVFGAGLASIGTALVLRRRSGAREEEV